MPTEVAAVLLIPAQGDPLGLLAEGHCGARPPMAWLSASTRGAYVGVWFDVDGDDVGIALVLAWDGKPHRFGCLWADDVLHPNEHAHRSWFRSAVMAALQAEPTPIDEEYAALLLSRYTIALLDSDRREIPNGN